MKVLGVDIGTYEVKTVLLEAGLFKSRVTAAASQPVGAGKLEDAVAAATRGAFDLVALSIDRRVLVTRALTLPFRDPAQLAKVVPFEAESQLPFTLDKGYVDYYVVDDKRADGGSEVLVFAVSHQDFRQLEPVYAAAGRTDALHQVDSYAVVNALLELADLGGGTVAIVDVGHTKTAVEILRDRRLAFSRCLDLGGESLTKALAKALGLEPGTAEALKHEVLTQPEGERPQERAALTAAIDRLIGQIQFTFRSFEATGASPVTRVVLTGGGARAPGFAERLSAKLGVPAAPARCDRPAAVPRELGEDLGRYAGAYGVALAGRDLVSPIKAAAGEISVDFFKEGRSFWKYHRQKISTAVTCALVAALAFVVLQLWQVRTLEAESAALAARIQSELEALNKANEARGRKKVATDALEVATREAQRRLGVLRKGPVSNIGILNEMSRQLPKGSSFTLRTFVVESGLVTIVADANSNDEADQITESIKKSPFFSGVRKTESGPSPENPSRVQFRVQYKVAG